MSLLLDRMNTHFGHFLRFDCKADTDDWEEEAKKGVDHEITTM